MPRKSTYYLYLLVLACGGRFFKNPDEAGNPKSDFGKPRLYPFRMSVGGCHDQDSELKP
jgi:hypothetical protein